MNKTVNVFSVVIMVVFALMSMTIILDLSISNIHLKAMPFKFETLSALALLFFFVNLIRVRRRWQGVKDMKAFRSFKFSCDVSDKLMRRSVAFSSLEILFMLGALTLFLRLSELNFDLVIVMVAVLVVLAMEGVVFLATLLKRGDAFRIGLNSKVVAYFGREMHLFFYTGLRRVEFYQNDLIAFQYKDDLVLFLPIYVIPESQRANFRDELIKQLESKKIYFDDALRNWGK